MRKKIAIIAYEMDQPEELWTLLTEGRAIVQKDFESKEQAETFIRENRDLFFANEFLQIIEVYID
jgi:hypothetical protein